ncbi:MAG: 6-pyruvoyltetrahydropterin synthase [Gemmatimonadota bacterium]|nr:MAG: 6-pyruvoyltetrahydropterin synthase [Gemmatimonadota bacterium]
MLVTRVERLHGAAPRADGRLRIFSFAVEATVDGPVDARSGMVVNLAEMKAELRRIVVEPLDGRCFNGEAGVPALKTPELVAREIWNRLDGRLCGLPLHRVRLRETGQTIAYRRRGEETMEITRVFEFSASHRLHSSRLSDAENRNVFGKCNNPAGHGHNYVLEVTMKGAPGSSGELVPAADFDRVVNEAVVDAWDHRHLNSDRPEFRDVNPTAEEIARVAWARLEKPLAAITPGTARLHRVKLLETARNHVEYFGPQGDGE